MGIQESTRYCHLTVTYTNREYLQQYLQNHTQTHKHSALLSFPLVHTLPSLRLTLALGTTEELPGCSCKVIKEALTAHWFRPPQSGLYWVTLEEGCGSGHQKRAVKVGQLTLVQLVRQHAGTRWGGRQWRKSCYDHFHLKSMFLVLFNAHSAVYNYTTHHWWGLHSTCCMHCLVVHV